MTLEELIDTLESADMLRIFKGDEEIFVGYLALFAPEVGHTNCKLYEQYKNDKVDSEQFRRLHIAGGKN